MDKWNSVLMHIVNDERYATGITYGKPRSGHQEGNVANHILQLSETLRKLEPILTGEEFVKLDCLIHVHDTFKYWASRNVPITDANSHASLAMAFCQEFMDSKDPEQADFLKMVQFHDEGYALYQQFEERGKYNHPRFATRTLDIQDIDLFMIFTVIDGFTPSKDHTKIRWWVEEVSKWREIPRAIQALEILGI